MIRVLVLALLASCAGPEQVITECDDYSIPGQWAELGDLRDAVIDSVGRDPGFGLRVYWCPYDDEGIPGWHLGGLYLGCNEMYAVNYGAVALRYARHEAAHCFRDRLFGDPDGQHLNAAWWALVE